MQGIILVDGSKPVKETMEDLTRAFQMVRNEVYQEGFNVGYRECAHDNEIRELKKAIKALKKELKVLKEELDDANEEIEEQKFVIKEILTLNL